MTTIDELIADSAASGGSERSNYQLFISRLCAVLGVPEPSFSSEANARNDYVFERSLDYRHPDGTTTKLFVDCYKRGHFVLEAKQSAQRQSMAAWQYDMFGSESHSRRLGHARRGSPGWDRIMRAAYTQAVDYTRHLSVEHGYPPFVILVDVGHVIELYADFSGQGKNYAQFPDARSFRIGMDDLRRPEIQARLKAVWTDPKSLDPTAKSAEVTRDIAGRLARIAKNLEGKHDARDVAEFLMRCLFTMFAEDIGLLPAKLMVNLLERLVDNPSAFPPAMESLWKTMNNGGFEPHSMAVLKHFNGGLFAQPRALALAPEDIHELLIAARMDWRDVEPAIFGTLLERALDPRERSKLGAHYTPRAFVERLVVPTIIEPLRADWERAQAEIEDALRYGKPDQARTVARAFHHHLCTVRVLDPACGTGNFLYVALELLKKLEGEVLAAIEELGEDQSRLMMDGETVSPRQFYGLELNPRAVPIADLVLWIGFLKWQLRTTDLKNIPEPILHAYHTIRRQDAILAHDGEELMLDEQGAPLTRWDGITRIPHPITGELVPDPEARLEVYRYKNPRPAEWPEVEFIVGNPPFIGGKDMRTELGDGYAEAAWAVRPHLPGGADFVMHFWDEAAKRLTRTAEKSQPNPLRRFGFITTNSITQTFSRRVIDHHMTAKSPLSLVFAIPDHPWLKAADKAAVRIAMTVVQSGEVEGALAVAVSENGLNTDAPQVRLEAWDGKVTSDLSIGADVRSCRPLTSNSLMAHKGVQLNGMGFILDAAEGHNFSRAPEYASRVRPFYNGRDLVQKSRGVLVIDTDGLTRLDLENTLPLFNQLLLERVKPERDQNPRETRKNRWWVYGENASVMRDAVRNLPRYIATSRTAAHRIFVFVGAEVLCESKVVVLALNSPAHLAVVSSRPHVTFANRAGGWQGVGNDPVYQHTETFYPFPFPNLTVNPALQAPLADLGERLDAFRKERLASRDFLTLTGLYNVLERVRELEWKAGPGRQSENADRIEPLTDRERDIYNEGQVAILKDIHDQTDTLVLAAYGWSDLAPALVGRPGATTPSVYKTDGQRAAEEELLARLVALNGDRAAEEARGTVRWLRPDYQDPRLGRKVAHHDGQQQEVNLVAPGSGRPKWPTDSNEQIAVLVDALRRAPSPVPPDMLATAFDGRNTPKRRERIASLLETLTTIGLARTGQLDGETGYFIPR